ncbi:hypothetical protein J6590_043220 [Homalodisca vitripennis]|nr:hypothetical protein J6590_043220 [Homalodisca vitripennis]
MIFVGRHQRQIRTDATTPQPALMNSISVDMEGPVVKIEATNHQPPVQRCADPWSVQNEGGWVGSGPILIPSEALLPLGCLMKQHLLRVNLRSFPMSSCSHDPAEQHNRWLSPFPLRKQSSPSLSPLWCPLHTFRNVEKII